LAVRALGHEQPAGGQRGGRQGEAPWPCGDVPRQRPQDPDGGPGDLEDGLQRTRSATGLCHTERDQGADAIVIASAGELEYLVYSVTLQDNGAPFLWWSRRSEATVRMRMVDVSDGTLLWSASVSMGPEGVILVPVIHHATANKELPESLTATPSAGAREAAHYLIRRLAWHMSGRRTEFPSEDRMILANHRNRAWTTGH